ncbi:hypothetical protein [Bacteroides thetaiotaomicron]|uniref:hypothetical protein n=1 Tax=Bacteroides thetaiotaomicron TaxID=818 RepID=UPI0021667C7E|nr:hypothetical protein [Bacteroides thetaiotaomicron]MCS2521916.1 hypothetical protein [Bacteroides thetaiotaomicron]
MKAKMKKLSLFLLVSVFAFCGCSDENDEVKGGDDNKGGENEKKRSGCQLRKPINGIGE